MPTSAILGTQLSGRVFRSEFERERTGTKIVKRAAKREIGEKLEIAYKDQLATNSAVKEFAANISRDNHVHLLTGLPETAADIDLGEMPPTLSNQQQLRNELEARIRAAAVFPKLFDAPGGKRFMAIIVEVTYGDQVRTSLDRKSVV